jgi:hypothetical protein
MTRGSARRQLGLFALIALVALPGMASDAEPTGARALPPHKTQTVVLIVSDGLRWQEIFTGAEEDLLNDKEGGSWLSNEDLRKRYWRPSAAERRALLFPFLWGTVAKHGQIFGNQALGSVAHGRTKVVTTWFWTVPTVWIISWRSCGTPCRPCRSTTAPPPS